MNPIGNGGFSQGRSTNRPPLFCGNNFAHWRSLMQMFIIDQDIELWDIIKKGPKTPLKTVDGALVPKTESEYTQADLENISKNYRSMNLLYCALDQNEFNRISSCKTAKEIWDKLEITYEGTSQVKETKISIFLRQYELFKMSPNETIKEMFTRFTQITNNLDSLGKTFSNEEKVRKVLRCLPKLKWGPKVTAIEEAQDLRNLSLDNLLGKLITHEMSLHEEEAEFPSTSKNLVLKTKTEESSDDEFSFDEDEEDEEDPFALMAKSFAKIMKMRKNFYQNKKGANGSKPIRNKFQKGSNKNTCYECGETGHFIKDCPKKRKEKYPKKDRKKKKAMAAWSDSDTSDSEKDEMEQANLCLMAEKSESKHEVTVNSILSSPSEIISEIISNMLLNEENLLKRINGLEKQLEEQEVISKIKSEEIEQLKTSHSTFEKDSSNLKNNFEIKVKTLNTKIKTLESENKFQKQKLISLNYNYSKLNEKCREKQSALVKFTKSEQTLNTMLGTYRSSQNKSGIGFNNNFSKSYKTTFVKAKKNGVPTCFYCCKKGHTKIACPYRRNDPHIIRNTFPTHFVGKVKQVWVPKGTKPPDMVYPKF